MARRAVTDNVDRRTFLSRLWRWGAGLIGVAGVWTSIDVLRPPDASGGIGIVPTLSPDEIPADSAIPVPQARSFLTRRGEEVVALSQRCPHLRCNVDWCDSSGQFECPCHGSSFNRVGEHRTGPAPRGMDSHPVRIVGGVVFVDTDTQISGAARGTAESIDEPVRGPACRSEE